MRTPALLLTFAFCVAMPLAAQSSAKSFQERQSALRRRGADVLAAETDREKAEDCSHAGNTAETNRCLQGEVDVTEARYEEYAAIIGDLLLLQPPATTKAERLDAAETRRSFLLAEFRWKRYREAECDAVGLLSCTQEVTRAHLRELAHLYARLWF